MPEWDDHVDADYDFLHDEHSAIDKSQREMAYIWDLFDYETTPIDGVLISREQVEGSSAKFDRLTENGIYEAPTLDLPKWLPTISDCGAWGYKELPFPPYGNEDMLEFYEDLDVTVGVTIDHLVLGSGHAARLYLDKRAFSEAFSPSDLPELLLDSVDVMIDTWPETWPPYVTEYEPSICNGGAVTPFDSSLFHGSVEDILDRLTDDPRAVYRSDDMVFRYELTLNNAAEMYDIYNKRDYSFRLMVAVQGWDPDSYVKAVDDVLELGYQYIGIGGVAGSPEEVVKNIVSAAGNRISDFERTNETRIDTHVFGFAKTGAFETIGRCGMSSFDSASMLRAAWTGGDNYHLNSEERFDALRVRYPIHSHDLSTAIEVALRSQELHHALRAYTQEKPIDVALREWHQRAAKALANLPDYLEEHRFDDQYNASRLREVEAVFRDSYRYGRELKASFGGPFRRRIVKLLRKDNPDNSVPWSEYLQLVSTAEAVFNDLFPTLLPVLEHRDPSDSFDQLWPLVETYAESDSISDEEHLEGYERLLREKPWKDCDCPMCSEHGIEVAIFRGNNRNRRRGFHNTRRFYDQFQEDLPKLLVLTKPEYELTNTETVEEYLKVHRSEFWQTVHDLPVVEIGVITANGIHEWWEESPDSISFDTDEMAERLTQTCIRYQDLFVDGDSWKIDQELQTQIEETGCSVRICDSTDELRSVIQDRLPFAMQSRLSSY